MPKSLRLTALFLTVLLTPFCLTRHAAAQTSAPATPILRHQTLLTGPGWQFTGVGGTETLPALDSSAYTQANWQAVSVPHNMTTRLHYEAPDQGWYRRDFNVPADLGQKRLYIVFEGVTSVADVYVNGQHLGQHRGAYTRFLFDITAAVHTGADNHLVVLVDNRVADIKDLLPNKTRLYKLWGGIYRKVWLLETSPAGVDPTDFASPGVYITPSNVSAASADLSVEVLLRSTLATPQQLTATATLLDPAGKPVKTLASKSATVGRERESVTLTGSITHPKLWDLLAPQVYHVRVDVFNAGKLVDSVTQPTGFRTVEWRWADNQVLVNGKRVRLFGADVHQEIEGEGNALSDEEVLRSFALASDLGLNFMRLPHYPHLQLEYDQCDARGILCWPEDGHSNDEPWGPTAQQVVTEMVKQNYNHPSIALWSLGNEAAPALAEAAAPFLRTLDPTRPPVVANMRCTTCDFRTTHSYPGWYGGKNGFRDYTPVGFITEIGAGGTVTTHTDYNQVDYKVDSYEPEEYQQLVAESHFSKAFDPANDKLALFVWWALRDFSDTKYKKPVGINTKGLTTYSGDKKDVYYLYRSFLRPNVPTVHIDSQRYFLRRGAVDNGIKVYSNAKSLTLTLNGKSVSTVANGLYTSPDGPYLTHQGTAASLPAPKVPNVFFWPVPLHTGKNLVSVSDGLGHHDDATIYFYGANGLPELPIASSPIKSLTSSNPANPAYLIDAPIHAEWPIYSDLDSTADNSWHELPSALEGARWIALRRVTKPDQATTLTFTLTRAATVYVVATSSDGSTSPSLADTKFTPTGGPFLWRDNAINLVPAQAYARKAAAGETITLALGDRDAIVLLK
jgi:beta-galactosidase